MPAIDNHANDVIQQWLTQLKESIAQNQLVKVLLSGRIKNNAIQTAHLNLHDDAYLVRVEIKAVRIKQIEHLSFVYRYKTKDITKNLLLADGIAHISQLLRQHFHNAHLRTQTQEFQLGINSKGKATLNNHSLKNHACNACPQGVDPLVEVEQSHNRQKPRLLALQKPFWTGLGVTDKQNQLIPAMSRKWKQINKFIEIFDVAFKGLHFEAKAVNVVDFGSGKGYLTFAMYDYLHQMGYLPDVTGVELRAELTNLCNTVAQDNKMSQLQFFAGDVQGYQPEKLDVMIALHACDIATDYAIHTGIRLNASMILCAPCCHKQLRPQLVQPNVLRPLLKHGIHLGQEAEMLTDTLRALYLEACGYDAKIIEFISLEHTSKNKMILAVKSSKINAAQCAQAMQEIVRLKAFYGISVHCLEQLLMADKRLPVQA